MKAEELQLGDYVIHSFGSVGKVTAIDNKVVTIYDKGLDDGDDHCEVTFACNEINPIKLTPEILKKNGFRKQNNSSGVIKLDTYWLGEEFGFRIHNFETDYYQFGLAKIRYVHELQHALRLCGINKEIEIWQEKTN